MQDESFFMQLPMTGFEGSLVLFRSVEELVFLAWRVLNLSLITQRALQTSSARRNACIENSPSVLYVVVQD